MSDPNEAPEADTSADAPLKSKRVRPTTLVLLLILAALILTPVWAQNKLIYKVVRYGEDAIPGDQEFTPFRKYKAADGLENWGSLIEPNVPVADPPFPAFYICFGGNATTAHGYQAVFQDIANQSGQSFFIPDYRGFGFNEGSPSEGGLEADALGLYDTMKSEGRLDRGIGIIGMSLGGGPALLVAHERPVDRLITMATFTSMDEMAARTVPWPIHLMCWNNWPNEKRLRAILDRETGERPAEVFIMHGKRDDLVPFEMGERLGRLPGVGLEFLPYDQANHLNLLDLSYDDFVAIVTRPMKR